MVKSALLPGKHVRSNRSPFKSMSFRRRDGSGALESVGGKQYSVTASPPRTTLALTGDWVDGSICAASETISVKKSWNDSDEDLGIENVNGGRREVWRAMRTGYYRGGLCDWGSAGKLVASFVLTNR